MEWSFPCYGDLVCKLSTQTGRMKVQFVESLKQGSVYKCDGAWYEVDTNNEIRCAQGLYDSLFTSEQDETTNYVADFDYADLRTIFFESKTAKCSYYEMTLDELLQWKRGDDQYRGAFVWIECGNLKNNSADAAEAEKAITNFIQERVEGYNVLPCYTQTKTHNRAPVFHIWYLK